MPFSIALKIRLFFHKNEKNAFIKNCFHVFLRNIYLSMPSQLSVHGIENTAQRGGSEHRWNSDERGESIRTATHQEDV